MGFCAGRMEMQACAWLQPAVGRVRTGSGRWIRARRVLPANTPATSAFALSIYKRHRQPALRVHRAGHLSVCGEVKVISVLRCTSGKRLFMCILAGSTAQNSAPRVVRAESSGCLVGLIVVSGLRSFRVLSLLL